MELGFSWSGSRPASGWMYSLAKRSRAESQKFRRDMLLLFDDSKYMLCLLFVFMFLHFAETFLYSYYVFLYLHYVFLYLRNICSFIYVFLNLYLCFSPRRPAKDCGALHKVVETTTIIYIYIYICIYVYMYICICYVYIYIYIYMYSFWQIEWPWNG